MVRRLIVFDWDGTLMDSAARIVNCFLAAAVEAGLKPPQETAIRQIIGLGLEEAVAALFPDAGEAQRRAAADSYREHFINKDRTEMAFFPGVEQGLAALKQRDTCWRWRPARRDAACGGHSRRRARTNTSPPPVAWTRRYPSHTRRCCWTC